MLTKQILVATAGQTLCGQEINEQWLDEIVSGYNQESYMAHVNHEHSNIKLGTVTQVKLGRIFVPGVGERKALYASFELNSDGLYFVRMPGVNTYISIEVIPRFPYASGEGAYLAGIALTRCPKAPGPEAVEFASRMKPDLIMSDHMETIIEFVEENESREIRNSDVDHNFLSKIASFFSISKSEEPKDVAMTNEEFIQIIGETLKPMVQEAVQQQLSVQQELPPTKPQADQELYTATQVQEMFQEFSQQKIAEETEKTKEAQIENVFTLVTKIGEMLGLTEKMGSAEISPLQDSNFRPINTTEMHPTQIVELSSFNSDKQQGSDSNNPVAV